MRTSKTLFVLCAAALLVLTGCFLGDRFFTARTVAVNFPAPAVLMVNDAQVQSALRVIDTALTSQGFHRDTNAPAQTQPDFVVSYTRYDGTGLRPLNGPNVYLRTNRLEVVVVEWGNRSGHLTAHGKQVCKSLRDALSKQYGAGKVRIER
jgi:hypothetical protein